MAAPTNFYQLQKQVAAAVWFMDLVGAPESRKKVVAEIDKELQKVLSEKAELDLGKSFKNALAKIKNDIGQSKNEAKAIKDKAISEAKILTDSAAEAQEAAERRTRETADRAAVVSVREAEIKKAAGKNAIDAATNTRIKGELANKEKAHLVSVDKLKTDRAKLTNAASEFKEKVG